MKPSSPVALQTAGSRRPGLITFWLSLLIAATALWPAAAQDAPPPFGPAAFEALLQRDPATGRPTQDVAELVRALPAALRSNFTLVYASRSPFAASITPQAPRVILFTDDARFIVTFIGDPTAPGHDLVETMSFDDPTATFRFKAYLLPAAVRAGWRPSAEAANCQGCHGADPHPIYDSYPLWPGFYGSVLDTFYRDRIGRAELAKYQAFLAGPARTGVYAALIFPPGSRTSPYLDPSRLRGGFELDPNAFAFLPNTRLGMALTELNRARVYRELAAAPGFAAHERDILAELLDCPSAPRPSATHVAAIRRALRAESAARLTRLGGRPDGPDSTVFGMEELKFVRALAEIDDIAQRAGADRTNWSMALEPGSLAFYDGVLSGLYRGRNYYLKEDLIWEILSHLVARDAAYRPYFADYAGFQPYGYPFGRRPEIGVALKACPLLTAHAT